MFCKQGPWTLSSTLPLPKVSAVATEAMRLPMTRFLKVIYLDPQLAFTHHERDFRPQPLLHYLHCQPSPCRRPHRAVCYALLSRFIATRTAPLRIGRSSLVNTLPRSQHFMPKMASRCISRYVGDCCYGGHLAHSPAGLHARRVSSCVGRHEPSQ